MKKVEVVQSALLDAMSGDLFPLMNLLDYLLYDKQIPLERLLEFAEKKFVLPKEITLETVKYFQ